MRVYISIPSWKNKDWKNKKLLHLFNQKVDIVICDKRPTQSEFENIIHEYDGAIIGQFHSINKEVLKNTKLKFVGTVT